MHSTLQYMFWFEESREVSFLTNAQSTLHSKDKYNVKILIVTPMYQMFINNLHLSGA